MDINRLVHQQQWNHLNWLILLRFLKTNCSILHTHISVVFITAIRGNISSGIIKRVSYHIKEILTVQASCPLSYWDKYSRPYFLLGCISHNHNPNFSRIKRCTLQHLLWYGTVLLLITYSGLFLSLPFSLSLFIQKIPWNNSFGKYLIETSMQLQGRKKKSALQLPIHAI